MPAPFKPKIYSDSTPASTAPTPVPLTTMAVGLSVANKDTTNNLEFSFDGKLWYPVFPKTSFAYECFFKSLWVRSPSGSAVAYSVIISQA